MIIIISIADLHSIKSLLEIEPIAGSKKNCHQLQEHMSIILLLLSCYSNMRSTTIGFCTFSVLRSSSFHQVTHNNRLTLTRSRSTVIIEIEA